MLNKLQAWMNRRALKDPAYEYLFKPDLVPEDELVCFDCETTSINPKKAELLSIGAVKIKNNKVLTSERLELFLKPSAGIDEDSIKVHHLRHCDLEHALEPEVAIEQFLEFIGGRPLVGYYLEFDVKMINKYIKPKLGIVLPNAKNEVSGLYYDKKQSVAHPVHVDLRFDAIMEDLALPSLGKHDAFNDALMTALMYVKLTHVKSLPTRYK